MKVYHFFKLILLLTALIGCKTTKGKSDEILSITLSKGGCYGTCPIYIATFKNDGQMLYNGKMFVEDKGEYVIKDNFDFNYLRDLVNQAGFFKLEDNYTSNMTDVPSISLSVRTYSGSKTITFNGAEPKDLRRIQVKLDSIIKNSNRENWIKQSENLLN